MARDPRFSAPPFAISAKFVDDHRVTTDDLFTQALAIDGADTLDDARAEAGQFLTDLVGWYQHNKLSSYDLLVDFEKAARTTMHRLVDAKKEE